MLVEHKNDTGSLLKSFLTSSYQIRCHSFDEKENEEYLKEKPWESANSTHIVFIICELGPDIDLGQAGGRQFLSHCRNIGSNGQICQKASHPISSSLLQCWCKTSSPEIIWYPTLNRRGTACYEAVIQYYLFWIFCLVFQLKFIQHCILSA